MRQNISRRSFLAGGVGLAGTRWAWAQAGRGGATTTPANAAAPQVISLVNGKIYTMDGQKRMVSRAVIENGRFIAVGNNVTPPPGRNPKVIDLKNRTVVPGLIDAHNHIVLVGNRPGRHVLLEDVFTIPDLVKRLQSRAAQASATEFVTTVGPIAAMQFAEQRLPNLTELDAVDRMVYLQASQGVVRTNSRGKAWFESKGVMVAADGTIGGGATGSTLSLKLLREQMLTPEMRKRNSLEALNYYAGLGITTHLDNGAFHSEAPSGGVANENMYTMHQSFLALHAEKNMPARLRFNYLHQDPANDPTLPTLSQRLKNSFPFFGDDWMKSGG